jgi:riboflavin biosynthesis pyrimidine reductase
MGMSVTAPIVVGADGCTSIEGSSTRVTSAADRQSFLKRRRLVDCIIVGGNTARNEPYAKTPVPLVIISRNSHPNLPAAHVWNLDPCDGVNRAVMEFGENILIEGGSSFISYLLDNNSIDSLELSVTSAVGGTDTFDFAKYLARANSLNEENIDGTIFYTAHFTRQQ